MSNWLATEKRVRVCRLLAGGMSVRDIACEVGVSKVTVSQYRKLFLFAELIGEEGLSLPQCKCGKAGGHRGWCKPRYENSEKRQKFISEWRTRNVKGS